MLVFSSALRIKSLFFRGFPPQFPAYRSSVRPGLFHELWVSRKDPVFVLPGLDCVFVQDPPYRAGAHGLAQRPSHSRGKIIQGLPADRFTSFRDALTSQGLDQCMIPRGKKWPYSHVRYHPPGRSFPPPSVFANDEPVGPIDPHGGQVAPGPSRGVHGPAAPTVIVARNDEMPSFGAILPELLPRSHRGRLGNCRDGLARHVLYRSRLRLSESLLTRSVSEVTT